eukprot:52915-Chlamydomonas_euryale.AAC.1
MAGTRLGLHCLSNDALYDRMGSWPLSRHATLLGPHLPHVRRESGQAHALCRSVGGGSPPAPPPQTAVDR